MHNKQKMVGDFLALILNHRLNQYGIPQQKLPQNLNLNLHPVNQLLNDEPLVEIRFYLQNSKLGVTIMVEQWILNFKQSQPIDSLCGRQCQEDFRQLPQMLRLSPLEQDYLLNRKQHPDFEMTHQIRYQTSKYCLDHNLYKCYHLPGINTQNGQLNIICRFVQQLDLTLRQHIVLNNTHQIQVRQRSISEQMNQHPNNIPLKRKNSNHPHTPVTPRNFKIVYSVNEDVTLLLGEKEAEVLLSQNSDRESDFIIQTIEEETDTSEWQVVDKSIKVPKLLKQLLKGLHQLKSKFNKTRYSSDQLEKIVTYFNQ